MPHRPRPAGHAGARPDAPAPPGLACAPGLFSWPGDSFGPSFGAALFYGRDLRLFPTLHTILAQAIAIPTFAPVLRRDLLAR